MQRKRAFTLIELLVVIAIIAILAAILFPVFAKAREKAKQSQSLNNVKQITLGVMQYSQDYDETFPGWVDGTSLTPSGNAMYHNTWDEQINSQIKSKDVFSNGNTGIKSPSDPKKERVLTYAMNGALIAGIVQNQGSVTWSQGPALLGPASVSNPSETILFAEVATDTAPPLAPSGAISRRPDAISGTGVINDNNGSASWKGAVPAAAASAVIDISPRDWVAPNNNATDNWYNENSANYNNFTSNGVARNLYSGGGIYGFVDGHVKFMKIADTVGIGKSLTTGAAVIPATAWLASNPNNMWYPTR